MHAASQPALKSPTLGSSSSMETEKEGQPSSPYFDLNHSGDVTAVLGKTALLNCRVKNIGNKTVSFTKKKVKTKSHSGKTSCLLT